MTGKRASPSFVAVLDGFEVLGCSLAEPGTKHLAVVRKTNEELEKTLLRKSDVTVFLSYFVCSKSVSAYIANFIRSYKAHGEIFAVKTNKW